MKQKGFLASMASIALCATVVVGGTYALFTSESKVNVAVTSGNVEVVATLQNLRAYSPTAIDLKGNVVDDSNAAVGTTFAGGGTATLEGNTLTLDRLAAGDKATFEIAVVNSSNVAIQWRASFEATTNTGLFAGLDVSIDGSAEGTEWTYVEAGAAITPETLTVIVELPADADETYMGKSCEIAFAVTAIQSNAYTFDGGLTTIQGASAAALSGKLNLSMPEQTLTLDTPDLAIGDAEFKKSSVTEITFNGGVIDTPYAKGDCNFSNQQEPHVYNEYNGSRIFLDVPKNCKLTFKNLTINGYYNFMAYQHSEGLTLEFVNCTFNGCWVGVTNGMTNISYVGCTFTLNGIDDETVKNTNPVWLSTNEGQTLSFDGCTFEGNRPIKYGEGASGATLNVTNCTFNLASSQYDIDKNRPDRVTAVRFSDNVTSINISDNTMNSGYAFYQTDVAPYSNEDYVEENGNVIADGILWRVEY